jgi:hypothetical protein
MCRPITLSSSLFTLSTGSNISFYLPTRKLTNNKRNYNLLREALCPVSFDKYSSTPLADIPLRMCVWWKKLATLISEKTGSNKSYLSHELMTLYHLNSRWVQEILLDFSLSRRAYYPGLIRDFPRCLDIDNRLVSLPANTSQRPLTKS